jgi:serine/threonine protein kinase
MGATCAHRTSIACRPSASDLRPVALRRIVVLLNSDPSALSLPGFSPGDLIARRYRIARVIGKGGMGVVLEALHVDLGERVAVKVLLPELSKNTEIVERFMHEARSAAKLRSPHVARVFDFGLSDDGSAYLVMDFLEGMTLGQRIDRDGALPLDEALAIAYQTALGLSEAHEARLIHRDVKPDNLFLEAKRDGRVSVKVLDFGISKKLDEPEALRLTRTGLLLGSPLYMSPEQMRASSTIDARSDVWALGAVMYESLTGVPPFSAPSMSDLVLQIAQDEVKDPRVLRTEMPDDLAQLILECLSKAPASRPADAGAVVARLDLFFASYGGSGDLGTGRFRTLPQAPDRRSMPSMEERVNLRLSGSVNPLEKTAHDSSPRMPGQASLPSLPSTMSAATLHGVTRPEFRPTSRWGFAAAGAIALLLAGGFGVRALMSTRIEPANAAAAASAPPGFAGETMQHAMNAQGLIAPSVSGPLSAPVAVAAVAVEPAAAAAAAAAATSARPGKDLQVAPLPPAKPTRVNTPRAFVGASSAAATAPAPSGARPTVVPTAKPVSTGLSTVRE